MKTSIWLLCCCPLLVFAEVSEDSITVAVAANFSQPMQRIAADFEAATRHQVTLVSGSTGRIYAQITHGAPYDVFLAADQKTPARLAQKGFAVPDSATTYAVGRLALWSPSKVLAGDGGQWLRQGRFRRVAIANPRLAPYGAAAMQVLSALGLRETLGSKLVQAENVMQSYHFVHSGNADLGFVAFAQLTTGNGLATGSVWLPPQDMYDPIRQDAILLMRARDNTAAKALMRFLGSASVQSIVADHGYETISTPPSGVR